MCYPTSPKPIHGSYINFVVIKTQYIDRILRGKCWFHYSFSGNFSPFENRTWPYVEYHYEKFVSATSLKAVCVIKWNIVGI